MWNKECGKQNRKIGEIESLFSTKVRNGLCTRIVGELEFGEKYSECVQWILLQLSFICQRGYIVEAFITLMCNCRPLPPLP